ncbi:MAG: competence/damage-inducible protein A [Oscillospiraceae bacterium]|nr:competence/damage-inducible protein A [Oscillospiraceae bacterium]
MPRIAEVIAVGTELLLGGTANTDAQDISQGLSELGIHCYYHTTVGDNPGRLREALRIAASRADILITTGGLGPTYDDLTKQTVCEFFGRGLVPHRPTWERIEAYFRRIGAPPTENNRQQALLPEDCVIFENDWGTAPGCAFRAGDTHILMLPGPPRECRAMFRGCAMPYLSSLRSGALVSRVVRVFGLGESRVETLLRERMENARNPTIAPYAREGECFLRVTASAETEAEARALTDPVVAELCRVLHPYVYGVDVDSLENVVFSLLEGHKKTLAAAESCTGGMIAARLTALPGVSRVFRGGVVAYDNRAKHGLLGVPEDILHRHGAVSGPVAEAMARGVCERTGASLGLAVTGLAGPDGDGSDTPVGTVFLALFDAEDGTLNCVRKSLGDERHRVRSAAAGHALNMVRRHFSEKG